MPEERFDFTRQEGFFKDNEKLNKPLKFLVCGAGAIGSALVSEIYRLFPEVTVLLVDFDRVEPVNLNSTKYFPHHVGQFKVHACRNMFKRKGFKIVPKIGWVGLPVEGFQEADLDRDLDDLDALFLCVDRMDVRKAIFEKVDPYTRGVDCVDGRIGKWHIAVYKNPNPGLFDSPEGELPCNFRQTTFTGGMTANLMLSSFVSCQRKVAHRFNLQTQQYFNVLSPDDMEMFHADLSEAQVE